MVTEQRRMVGLGLLNHLKKSLTNVQYTCRFLPLESICELAFSRRNDFPHFFAYSLYPDWNRRFKNKEVETFVIRFSVFEDSLL